MKVEQFNELNILRDELSRYLMIEVSEPLKRKDCTIQESLFFMGANASHFCKKWERLNELIGLLVEENKMA